ncbi:helix-turn-helix domain-containing protein [Dyadobacter pollutisoli]|jgi:excisionase family DNA binding protein|uniref:Helix-turn-helix domain-containing protein n=1 Tax=Dyadobacter pollutisoli TaxID=2910158 RepID=A0A9E8SM62_9BACT|nr:helix-turn-helix domain-containing protein [Dyadobacter pollutisoli]WAC12974.1 helix-turn-helix domain-containing protein [Dyadobacter pollutisoli]
MEQYSFDQLPRAVSELHQKIDSIQDLLLESRQQILPTIELMTISQAAEFLNLSVQTLYGKVCHREIPVSKKGKRLYFYKSELEEWIKSGKKKTMSELREQLPSFTGSRKGRLR